ncbi:MAG: hypothetical protein IJA65_02400 [Acholeplasmatales bacterium]|nr:hypothetical protein [Acholeplasmatales bacterium]
MVVRKKGHKNSKGEKAEWCIVSHETGKILSSHKSKAAAEINLTYMSKFKHIKEDFDSAKKFLEDKGYILLKESSDIKSKIRDLIKDMLDNRLIDSYGDFTNEGRDIIQDKCGSRFRNFVPIPDGSLKQLLDDASDEVFFENAKKIWLPYKEEDDDDDQWSWTYFLIRSISENEIDNMRYFCNLSISQYNPKLTGNDDMDYEI